MYTIEQVAEQVELLKPDLTSFFEFLNTETAVGIIQHLQNTNNVFVKLLKTEITLMLHVTHQKKSIWSMQNAINEILISNLKNYGLGLNVHSYNCFVKYVIKDSLDPTCHITAHLKDPKPYLPKYLWDKIRTNRKLQVEPIKVLQPNDMSLKIFQNYLNTTKKPMSSIEAKNYLKQLTDASFKDIKQDFMEVIFEKCTKPSIDLQKELSGNGQNIIPTLPNQDSPTVLKYMTLSRSRIRNLSFELNIPVSSCIYNTLDSTYKPFITNMYRIPDTTMQEVSYLFNAMLILQVSVSKNPNPVYEYFIKQIGKHLALSESAHLIKELKQTFTLTNQAFIKLTN